MANKKITELPLILSGDISSNDVFPIVDVELDITNKVTVDQLKGYINSGTTEQNYKYIASGLTVTIPKNTQKFIYGDIIIDGELIIEEDSELVVLNGDIIVSGGTIVQFGDIIVVDLPEINTIINGPNTITIGDTSTVATYLEGQVKVGSFNTPPIGIEGAIYYDTITKKHYGFDGTTWNAFY